MSNIRVAVRVRPLSEKEKDDGSKEIVAVHGNSVSIENIKVLGIPEFGDSRARFKEFTFDHCYDSMQLGSSYSTQTQVFEDLGGDVLKSAYDGFNACVFAYGQTGTGKTHTMMGYQDDPGLIPRICEGLFSHVSEDAVSNITYRVDISYFEIYNEKVRDLLQPYQFQQNPKFSLRVRNHPQEGPYVEGLSWHRVKNNEEIQSLIDKGNEYRVTAETYIHDRSSRSHAIVTVCFTQARLEENRPSEIVSKINLVDLAGSERADPSSKPDFRKRLTEGANINRSLVTLGYIIKALAERSLLSWDTDEMGSMQNFNSSGGGESLSSNSPSGPNKQKLPFIPYRDSVLTWLLKDSLGGNSKTIMIATVTPASQFYSETLSTLRYAQRAKNIVNKPRINEDGNVALIRELRREIGKLTEMLADARKGGNLLSLPDSEDSIIAEKLHENEEMAKQLTESWMCKWSSTHDIMKESDLSIRGLRNRSSSMGVMIDSQLPYLIGMDDDVLSTGVVIFHLKEGDTYVGRDNAEKAQDIVLIGPNILTEHCIIRNNNGEVTLYPHPGSMCAVQGQECLEPTKLSQGDYVILGGDQVFRFNNPTEAAKLRENRRKNTVTKVDIARNKSQGSLNALNTSHLSFGGLSRASSYSSIAGDDQNCLSPLSQLGRSYPNYAAQDLCLELEKKHQSEQEQINLARHELEKLRQEHERAEDQRQEKEEQMYVQHEQHKQDLQDQKEHLARLIAENERAREKAEEELQHARESLAKEKEAFQKELDAERKRLKELQKLEKQHSVISSGFQTDSPTTATTSVGCDDNADDDDNQDEDGPPSKTKFARRMSLDDQMRELEENEFSRRMSYRETEQSLSIQEEDIEDQYLQTQDQIQAKIHKIKIIEEEYKELDKTHLEELNSQTEKLKDLQKKEAQLEVYIQEKEELINVVTGAPTHLRSATSELHLASNQTLEVSDDLELKTTSLQDIQSGLKEDPGQLPYSPRSLQRSASAESLESPISDMSEMSALNIEGKEMDKKPQKDFKISNTARDVTSRLYKPPEPKFKYVPKVKEREVKPVARSKVIRDRDNDPHGRGSPSRIIKDKQKSHSPSPQRQVHKHLSPSPARDLGTKGNKSEKSVTKTVNQKSDRGGKTGIKTGKADTDSERENSTRDRTKSPSKISGTASPDRSNLSPVSGRLGASGKLRQMASASNLASVPESLNECTDDNGHGSNQSEANPVIKRRNRRGRSDWDDEEFRTRSAPDSQTMADALDRYTEVMNAQNTAGIASVESVVPTFTTSVSVDGSQLSTNYELDGKELELPSEIITTSGVDIITENKLDINDTIDDNDDSSIVSGNLIDSEHKENVHMPDSGKQISSENDISDTDDITKTDKVVLGKREYVPESDGALHNSDHQDIVPSKKSKPAGNISPRGEENYNNLDRSLSCSEDSLDLSSDSLEQDGREKRKQRLTQSLPNYLLEKDKQNSEDSFNDSLEEPHIDVKEHDIGTEVATSVTSVSVNAGESETIKENIDSVRELTTLDLATSDINSCNSDIPEYVQDQNQSSHPQEPKEGKNKVSHLGFSAVVCHDNIDSLEKEILPLFGEPELENKCLVQEDITGVVEPESFNLPSASHKVESPNAIYPEYSKELESDHDLQPFIETPNVKQTIDTASIGEYSETGIGQALTSDSHKNKGDLEDSPDRCLEASSQNIPLNLIQVETLTCTETANLHVLQVNSNSESSVGEPASLSNNKIEEHLRPISTIHDINSEEIINVKPSLENIIVEIPFVKKYVEEVIAGAQVECLDNVKNVSANNTQDQNKDNSPSQTQVGENVNDTKTEVFRQDADRDIQTQDTDFQADCSDGQSLTEIGGTVTEEENVEDSTTSHINTIETSVFRPEEYEKNCTAETFSNDNIKKDKYFQKPTNDTNKEIPESMPITDSTVSDKDLLIDNSVKVSDNNRSANISSDHNPTDSSSAVGGTSDSNHSKQGIVTDTNNNLTTQSEDQIDQGEDFEHITEQQELNQKENGDGLQCHDTSQIEEISDIFDHVGEQSKDDEQMKTKENEVSNVGEQNVFNDKDKSREQIVDQKEGADLAGDQIEEPDLDKPGTRTIGICTSPDLLDTGDDEQDSDDSFADTCTELQVLQDALDQLPARPAPPGPQLSTARRATRQRAMIRQKLRAGDSDGVGPLSDESPGSVKPNKSSSRPDSGSRRRKRQTASRNSRQNTDQTSDDYDSSENDSTYSEDSVDNITTAEAENGLISKSHLHSNGGDRLFQSNSGDVNTVPTYSGEEMLARHLRNRHERRSPRQIELDRESAEFQSPDGSSRSVGVQTLNRHVRGFSSSSMRTDLSDIENSFASGEFGGMVLSPVSLWNSNERQELDRNSSSSSGIIRTLSDVEKSLSQTQRSSSRSNASFVSQVSNLDRGPTEVWSSSMSDLRPVSNFREDLSYVMETEVMSPGASALDNVEDFETPQTFALRTSLGEGQVEDMPDCSTPRSGRNVNISFPESQIHQTTTLDTNTPVTYHVTVHEDNTNVVYNMEKTEYKTYALRNQESPREPGIIPDTIHVNIRENVSSQTEQKYESHKTESVILKNETQTSNDDYLVLENSNKVSYSSARDINAENGHTKQVSNTREEIEESKNFILPAHVRDQLGDNRKNVSLQLSGVVGATSYHDSTEVFSGEEPSKSMEDQLDDSECTSDYGTITSIDGRKGFISFTSDSEEDSMLVRSPRSSPHLSLISGPLNTNLDSSYVPVQEESLETAQNASSILTPRQDICTIENIELPATAIASTIEMTLPSEVRTQLYEVRHGNVDEEGYFEQAEELLEDLRPAKIESSDEESTKAKSDDEKDGDELETDTSSVSTVRPSGIVASQEMLVENEGDSSCAVDNLESRSCLETDNNMLAKSRVLPRNVDLEYPSPISSQKMCSPKQQLETPYSSSTEDSFLSVEQSETSSCSSDYRTPQQSPVDFHDEENIPIQVEEVVIPDTVSQDMALATTPRIENIDSIQNAQPVNTSSPKRPTTVRTVSVNTDNSSAPTTPLAYTTQKITERFGSGNDPDQIEVYRKEIEQKIASIQCQQRSLSDSAISSDYTDGDSSSLSPRSCKHYDFDKCLFGDNKPMQDRTTVRQSSFKPGTVLDFDGHVVRNFQFKDSGNVYDQEHDERGNREVLNEKQNEQDTNRIQTESESIKDYNRRLPAEGIVKFPESVITASLAIKPFPVKRSLSLDSIAALVNTGTVISRAVRESAARTIETSPQNEQDDHEQISVTPADSELDKATMDECDKENIPPQTPLNNHMKSTSFTNLQGGDRTKEYHRSLSEGNIEDFDDNHNSSADSNNSITFVFVGKEYSNGDHDECDHIDSFNAYGNGSDPEGLSHEEAEQYKTTRSNNEYDNINISGRGHPSPDSSDNYESVLSRSASGGSIYAPENIEDDQVSSHSASEEIEEIIIRGNQLKELMEQSNVSVDYVGSPTTDTDNIEEYKAQLVHCNDTSPLRHKFGIDEKVLPISERSVSADNLPKHLTAYKDIQRSRSTGMLDVGVTLEQESESDVFPPAPISYDEDRTDPSFSLKTMSENGLDQISQRTVSDIGASLSNRSSGLDTTSNSMSSARVRSVCSVSSSSSEESYEEIVINYSNSKDRNKRKRIKQGPDSNSSEGEIDIETLEDRQAHIKHVLDTVEKFILPKPVLVDRGVSTEMENETMFVSIGIQTSTDDISETAVSSIAAQVRQDNILPALAAPFRAQSMDSFGIGTGTEQLQLSEGAISWVEMSQLMVETTDLLRKINGRLPEMGENVSISSPNESQAILKQWEEISIQTGQSLVNLSTVGLQTDEVEEISETSQDTNEFSHADTLETSNEFTQVDLNFRMKPLNTSETIISEMLPGLNENISCEMSIQTDPDIPSPVVTESIEVDLDNVETTCAELSFQSSKLSNISIKEKTYKQEKDEKYSSFATESEKPLRQSVPSDEDNYHSLNDASGEAVTVAESHQHTPEKPDGKFIAQVKLDLGISGTGSCQPSDDRKIKSVDAISNQDSASPKKQSILPGFTLPNTKEIEDLRKEHKKLMENLKTASDNRSYRTNTIKFKKQVLPVPPGRPNEDHDASNSSEHETCNEHIEIVEVGPGMFFNDDGSNALLPVSAIEDEVEDDIASSQSLVDAESLKDTGNSENLTRKPRDMRKFGEEQKGRSPEDRAAVSHLNGESQYKKEDIEQEAVAKPNNASGFVSKDLLEESYIGPGVLYNETGNRKVQSVLPSDKDDHTHISVVMDVGKEIEIEEEIETEKEIKSTHDLLDDNKNQENIYIEVVETGPGVFMFENSENCNPDSLWVVGPGSYIPEIGGPYEMNQLGPSAFHPPNTKDQDKQERKLSNTQDLVQINIQVDPDKGLQVENKQASKPKPDQRKSDHTTEKTEPGKRHEHTWKLKGDEVMTISEERPISGSSSGILRSESNASLSSDTSASSEVARAMGRNGGFNPVFVDEVHINDTPESDLVTPRNNDFDNLSVCPGKDNVDTSQVEETIIPALHSRDETIPNLDPQDLSEYLDEVKGHRRKPQNDSIIKCETSPKFPSQLLNRKDNADNMETFENDVRNCDIGRKDSDQSDTDTSLDSVNESFTEIVEIKPKNLLNIFKNIPSDNDLTKENEQLKETISDRKLNSPEKDILSTEFQSTKPLTSSSPKPAVNEDDFKYTEPEYISTDDKIDGQNNTSIDSVNESFTEIVEIKLDTIPVLEALIHHADKSQNEPPEGKIPDTAKIIPEKELFPELLQEIKSSSFNNPVPLKSDDSKYERNSLPEQNQVIDSKDDKSDTSMETINESFTEIVEHKPKHIPIFQTVLQYDEIEKKKEKFPIERIPQTAIKSDEDEAIRKASQEIESISCNAKPCDTDVSKECNKTEDKHKQIGDNLDGQSDTSMDTVNESFTEIVEITHEHIPLFQNVLLDAEKDRNWTSRDVRQRSLKSPEGEILQRSDIHPSKSTNTSTQHRAPLFGRSDDATQVSMEFSDDFTQTDDENSMHFSEPKLQLNSLSNTKLCDSPPGNTKKQQQIIGTSERLKEDLEKLQQERLHILDLLGMNYLPTSLTVELLEAKLNYCIGQTDLLLESVEDEFSSSDTRRPYTREQQRAVDYVSKYRSDLKKSKQDIQECREKLSYRKSPGIGRGRNSVRKRDLFNHQRQSFIDAFKLERKREQQDYERSRHGTPIRGNTPLKGNTPLMGNSPVVTPRSERSRSSSPTYITGYMTPKEHKEHLVDLRRQLIRDIAEEEYHHRSVSPVMMSPKHSSPLHRSPVHNRFRSPPEIHLGYSPKVSVSLTESPDRTHSNYNTFMVSPGTSVPRSSSLDGIRPPSYHTSSSPSRYVTTQFGRHLSPPSNLDTKMTAESIFSPEESAQIYREIEELKKRTPNMSAPLEEMLRRSSFSSTGSHRSTSSRADVGISPRTQSDPRLTRPRLTSPELYPHDQPLSLNLESLQDDAHGPYSPYSAYAREHIIPNERTSGGILRGTYQLYDSGNDRSDTSSNMSFGSDTASDSGLYQGMDEETVKRLRPVRSSDIKARIGRHKR